MDEEPKLLDEAVPKKEALEIVAYAVPWIQRRDAALKRGIHNVTDATVSDKRYREYWLKRWATLEYDDALRAAATADLLELKADSSAAEEEIKSIAKGKAALSLVGKGDSKEAQVQEILLHVKQCGILPTLCKALEEQIKASVPAFDDIWQKLHDLEANLQSLFDHKAAYTERTVRSQYEGASSRWLHKVGEQLHRELTQKLDRTTAEDEQSRELALRCLELINDVDAKELELGQVQLKYAEEKKLVSNVQVKLDAARNEARRLGEDLNKARSDELAKASSRADGDATKVSQEAVAALKTQLDAKDKELGTLRESLQLSTTKQASLEKDLSIANKEKSDAQEQQKRLEKDGIDATKNILELREKKDRLAGQLSDIKDVEKQLENQKAEVVRLGKALANSKATAASEEQQKTILQEHYEELQGTNEWLQEQYNTINSTSVELRKGLEKSNSELRNELDLAKADVEALRSEKIKMAEEIETKATKIKALEENLATVQKSLQEGEDIRATVSSLSSDVQTLTEQLGEAKAKNADLQGKIDKADEQVKSKSELLEKVESHLQDARKTVDEEKSQRKQLELEIPKKIQEQLSQQSEKEAHLHRKNMDAALAEKSEEMRAAIATKQKRTLEQLAKQKEELEAEHGRQIQAEREALQQKYDEKKTNDIAVARSTWEQEHQAEQEELAAKHQKDIADAISDADSRERTAKEEAHKATQSTIEALNTKHRDVIQTLTAGTGPVTTTAQQQALEEKDARIVSLVEQVKDMKKQRDSEKKNAERSQKHITRMINEHQTDKWKSRDDIKKMARKHVEAITTKAEADVASVRGDFSRDKLRLEHSAKLAEERANYKVLNAQQLQGFAETKLARTEWKLQEAQQAQSELQQFTNGFGVISRVLSLAPTLTFSTASQVVQDYQVKFPGSNLVILDRRWCSMPIDQLIVMDVDRHQFMWVHGNGCMWVNQFSNVRLGHMWHESGAPITCLTFQVFHERWYVPLSLHGGMDSVAEDVSDEFIKVFGRVWSFWENVTSTDGLVVPDEGEVGLVVVDERANPRMDP